MTWFRASSRSEVKRAFLPQVLLRKLSGLAVTAGIVCGFAHAAPAPPPAFPYYKITVLDRATNAPVPAIKLMLTNDDTFWTDSAGRVSFYKPELMGKQTWFHVSGYGYSFPLAGFNYRGLTLTPSNNGSRTLYVDREFASQRVFRMTGTGVFDQSIMAGVSPPPTQDDAAFPVVAHESVSNTLFDGQYYWFWTVPSNPQYPEATTFTVCATSPPPGGSGLQPEQPVSLTYLRDASGRARNVLNVAHSGPTRLNSPRVAMDGSARRAPSLRTTNCSTPAARLWDADSPSLTPAPGGSIMSFRSRPATKCSRRARAWDSLPQHPVHFSITVFRFRLFARPPCTTMCSSRHRTRP